MDPTRYPMGGNFWIPGTGTFMGEFGDSPLVVRGCAARFHIQLPPQPEAGIHGQAVTTRQFFEILVSAALVTLAACNNVAAVRPLSPQAQQVRVEERDPPDDATALGPIAVTDGQGCSFNGDKGTREGATALLKEAATQRGANFVKLTKVTEPYNGHDCVHREFKLEGVSYRLAGTPVPVPVPVAAPVVAPVQTPVGECVPICSPGYACEAGICRPLCNPACAADQICRTDRVCVPAAPAPAPVPAP